MPSAAKRKKATRTKVSAHRARMRAQGMRLLQIWVPDTRSPEFAREARRQSRALARSPQEKEDIAFVESLSSWLWEDK
ncbi:MAG: antitoxin MazE family protein [Xanthobacteraceae bacterium]